MPEFAGVLQQRNSYSERTTEKSDVLKSGEAKCYIRRVDKSSLLCVALVLNGLT